VVDETVDERPHERKSCCSDSRSDTLERSQTLSSDKFVYNQHNSENTCKAHALLLE
jgi:hypothetical protein